MEKIEGMTKAYEEVRSEQEKCFIAGYKAGKAKEGGSDRPLPYARVEVTVMNEFGTVTRGVAEHTMGDGQFGDDEYPCSLDNIVGLFEKAVTAADFVLPGKLEYSDEEA